MFDPLHRYWHFNVELNEILANMFLRSFGLSMIGIFIPIFFLQNGLTLDAVLIEYFAIIYITSIIANIFTSDLLRQIGVKHTIMLSIPFLIVQLVLLQFYTSFPVHHSIIAVFGGLSLSLYWMGLHTHFALSTDKRREGAESGVMFTVVRIASIFGPLAGGLILVRFGFQTLFLLSLVLVVLSAVPLTRTADIRRPIARPWTTYFKMENARYTLRFFVEGFRLVVEGVLWPVFIFLLVSDFVEVGAAGTLAIAGSAVLSAVLGRISDNIGSTRLLRLTSLPLALLFYLMPLATTSTLILLISLLVGIAAVGVDLPIYRSFIRHAKKNDIVGYTLFRETILNIGKLVALSFAAVAVDAFSSGFYMASILSLLLVL